MEETIRIKIQLIDRGYTLSGTTENESLLRQAGKAINEQFEGLKKKYPNYDRQDLFSLVAFYAMVEKLEADAQKARTEQEITHKLSHINQLIDRFSS